MKPLLICLFTFLFLTFPSYSAIEIEYLGNTIRYDGNPKLSDVLSRLILSRDFYWHNASLFDINDTQALLLKREILGELDQLLSKTGSKTQKYHTLSTLRQQISQWRVATKLPVELDYDLIRVKDDLDRRLDDGKYFLHLPFREYHVTLLGAVKDSKKLPHLAASSVDSYFDDASIELLDYVETSMVFVIHPNGNVKKATLSLHTQEHIEVPPAGFIYVPIRELPFDNTNTELNQKIARLAGNLLP